MSDETAPDVTGGQDVGGAGGEPSVTPPAPARPVRDRKPSKRPKAKRKPGAGRPPGAPNKSTTAARTRELEAELARALVFPAIPAMMLAPDPASQEFLSAHFYRSGPATAKQLALASESSPQLREILENMTRGSVTVTIAMAAVAYAAPPVLWMLGVRGPAQAVSMATSMDPAQLEALAAMLRESEPAASEPVEPSPPPGGTPAEQAPGG